MSINVVYTHSFKHAIYVRTYTYVYVMQACLYFCICTYVRPACTACLQTGLILYVCHVLYCAYGTYVLSYWSLLSNVLLLFLDWSNGYVCSKKKLLSEVLISDKWKFR